MNTDFLQTGESQVLMKNMINVSTRQWPGFNPSLLGTLSPIVEPKKISSVLIPPHGCDQGVTVRHTCPETRTQCSHVGERVAGDRILKTPHGLSPHPPSSLPSPGCSLTLPPTRHLADHLSADMTTTAPVCAPEEGVGARVTMGTAEANTKQTTHDSQLG